MDKNQRDTNGLPKTVRSVYILNPDKEVAVVITYPATTGRNMNEILRVIDSLQLTAKYKVATPVNWDPQSNNDRVMVDYSLTDQEADSQFNNDVEYVSVPSERFSGAVLKHYMRYTDNPTKTQTKEDETTTAAVEEDGLQEESC